METGFYTPAQITENFVETGVKKTDMPFYRVILLAIMAGVFITLAGAGSNVAVHNIAAAGLAKCLAGLMFAAGLLMVIIAGGELFTGNCLIAIACLEKKIKWRSMWLNLTVVYFANLAGALVITALLYLSGQWDMSGGELGAYTLKIAANKCSLEPLAAFSMGILCNILVCLGVWMGSAAKDIAGKVFAVLFPIWVFVTSGFEHSVANMYYVPAGMFASLNDKYVSLAIAGGLTQEKLGNLNIGTFLWRNALPVTAGNIVGGAFCIGFMYWLIFLRKKRKKGETL